MPNRILRDWTDSETIDKFSIYAERFFTRLIMKVDDYGRYSANVKILKSTLFPLKTDIRETDITLWLTECEQCGVIALYNVASKEYLQIENFKQVLRQKKEKYPPPENLLSTCVADDKQMTSIRMVETKRNETEEKRSELPHTLLNSNLFRAPVIPTYEIVKAAFLKNGGNEIMALKFFEKHESTGWYLNNSPIVNFNTLIPGCISAWGNNGNSSSNEEKKSNYSWM